MIRKGTLQQKLGRKRQTSSKGRESGTTVDNEDEVGVRPRCRCRKAYI